jgi:hypothetical protein
MKPARKVEGNLKDAEAFPYMPLLVTVELRPL